MVDGLTVATITILSGLWIVISAFSPFTTTAPQLGLDASWVAVMGEAANQGLRWGPDIAFTYGPASTLVTAYFNAAYLGTTLPLLIATCLLAALCVVLLAERSVVWHVGASIAVGLVAACSNTHPDSVFLALPVLPLLLVMSRERQSPVRHGVAAATALTIGMIGLSKMTYPLAALPIFLLGDATMLSRRRIPVLTVPCGFGFLLAERLYGQSLTDLPAFLARQGEVVAGYGGAMAIDGSRAEFLGYLAACAALLLLTLAAERSRTPRHAGSRAVVPLGLAWTLFVLMKAGFIRQDTHTPIAWFGLALVAVLVALARLRPVCPSAAAVTSAAVAGATLLGPSLAGFPDASSTRGVAAALDVIVTRAAAQLSAAWSLASDPPGFAAAGRAATAQGWRDIAASAPLPRLEGGVDIIPSLQSRVIAAGLDYRPRPSFQEYSSYTPGLLAGNEDRLTTPRAPRWILFGPETGLGQMTIDGRYPNFAEGALWPALMRLYRPGRRIGDLVALERRRTPAPVSFGPAQTLDVRLDGPVTLDPGHGGAVFAALDLRPTLLGRVLSLLYRAPILTMSVTFADGHTRPYRFVPGIAAAGFVLSPAVDNASEFVDLAEGRAPPLGRTVRSFGIHSAMPLSWLLWQPASVEIRPLSIGTDLGSTPSAEPASAWDSLAAGEGLAPGAVDLATVAPSLLSVQVAGLPRVELGYGLALGDDEPAGAEVLCFAVHPADGTGRTLWRDCLNRGAEPDRKPHALSLALPPDVSEVALETSCQSGCQEGVESYWARPSP